MIEFLEAGTLVVNAFSQTPPETDENTEEVDYFMGLHKAISSPPGYEKRT